MVNCYVPDIADLQKYLEHFQKLKKMHSQKFVNVCTRSFYAFASKPENLAFKAVIVHIQ